ncbi:unnamed protein product, partial [Allacma fusca]
MPTNKEGWLMFELFIWTTGICGVSFEKKLKPLQHKVKIHREPVPYFCKEENCRQ